MINDRVVLVGIAWTLVLIGLLVVREFLRAMDGRSWQPAIRATNILVVVMLVAVGLAAAIRLTALATPPDSAGSQPPPTATPSRQPIPSGPAATPPTPAATPISVATFSVPPDATATPATPPTEPPPTPPPAPPSPTPPPTPSPEVTPPPRPAGTVSAGPTFRVYELRGGAVSSYRSVRAAQRFTADATAPDVYAFPTLGDPEGTIRLVRILDGPFADAWVSPDDRGVEYMSRSA